MPYIVLWEIELLPCSWCGLLSQVIDLKGELANSKAGQAAIKQAVNTAAKEQAASAAREKLLKVLPDFCMQLLILPSHLI